MSWQLDVTSSPIELERYFFTDLHFEAYPAAEDGKAPFPPLQKPRTDVVKLDDQGQRWSVFLQVESEKPVEEEFCFSFRLNICGILRWSGEERTEENAEFIDKAIAVSGASLLFGSCRELLQTIVSKGPYGGYRLPTVRFVPAEQGPPDGQEKTSSKNEG